jgi:ubiquinone/menaquinone biosynthesis C-methylase UbiE
MNSFEQKYYEADEFWKEGMITDEANLRRLRQSVGMVPPDTGNLIDLGCGNGMFASLLHQMRPEIDSMSMDRSEAAIKYVKTKSTVGELTAIPFQNEAFDCSTCFEVLEHIPYPVYDKVLSELARVSKKNIIISVPYLERTERDLTKCPACHASFNVELHLRKYSEEDIIHLFDRFGFECQTKTVVEKKNEIHLGVRTFINLRDTLTNSRGKFRSPICPVCGFENREFALTQGSSSQAEPKRENTSLKSLMKKYWPKTFDRAFWIVAKYKRK